MPWLEKGDAQCDNCPSVRTCVPDRAQSIQMMRAAGWRHLEGTTLGGKAFETILCPPCVGTEHKRSRLKAETDQQELPLDFESGRVVPGRQGFSSR